MPNGMLFDFDQGHFTHVSLDQPVLAGHFSERDFQLYLLKQPLDDTPPEDEPPAYRRLDETDGDDTDAGLYRFAYGPEYRGCELLTRVFVAPFPTECTWLQVVADGAVSATVYADGRAQSFTLDPMELYHQFRLSSVGRAREWQVRVELDDADEAALYQVDLAESAEELKR